MRWLLPLLFVTGCATQWPMTTAEVVAVKGLQARGREIEAEVARVASGDRQSAQGILNIVTAVRQFDADAKAVVEASGHGAVVASGTNWVRVK